MITVADDESVAAVSFVTNEGVIEVEFVREWSPIAVGRVHELGGLGYWDGARIYRVNERYAQFGYSGDPELDASGPDGLTVDARGNVYATYTGIVILDPDGEVIGRIPVPEHTANCAFGGGDNKTLYITARRSLYAIDMKVAGAALQKPATAKEVARRTVKAGHLALRVPEHWKESQPRVVAILLSAPVGEGTPRIQRLQTVGVMRSHRHAPANQRSPPAIPSGRSLRRFRLHHRRGDRASVHSLPCG